MAGGGLSAIMGGVPPKKKETPIMKITKVFKASGLHISLVLGCVLYVYLGALAFLALEYPHEEDVAKATAERYAELQHQFLQKAESIVESSVDEQSLNSSLYELLDEHTEQVFVLFEKSPIEQNFFDSEFYSNGNYNPLWTMNSAILFTSTTMVPVGFGLVTPLTSAGRLFLCAYAIFGIPLALTTMSDLGKFFCDYLLKAFNQKMTIFTPALLILLFLYPLIGGIVVYFSSTMTLFDSIYYCSITILTVGYGDIAPPIPIGFLILFIVVGVTLVTITVDVVAAGLIHQIHFLGRQMGHVRDVAGKVMQVAQKINISKGLGMGMAQLGAFAKMGLMIQLSSDGRPVAQVATPPPALTEETVMDEESHKLRKSTSAYDPDIDFDLIDLGGGSQIQCFDNDAFGYFDQFDTGDYV